MWQGFWIFLWTLTRSFSRLSRVAAWFLLRKITKDTSSVYQCIFRKSIRKSQINIFGVAYFVKVLVLYTTAYIHTFTRNLSKVLFTALKYKKALTAILKENLRFKKLRQIYIGSQKKQKRAPKIINKFYQNRCGCK